MEVKQRQNWTKTSVNLDKTGTKLELISVGLVYHKMRLNKADLTPFPLNKEENVQSVGAVVGSIQEASVHQELQHLLVGQTLVRLLC